MPTNTENIQLLDQLPAVINLEMTLLENWCNDNDWTEIRLSSDYKISALPPDSSIRSPLPKEAFTQLERLGDISHELRELQSIKQSTQKKTKLLIPLVISCAVMIGIHKILPSLINTSSQRVIVSTFFNYLIILLLIILNTIASLTLYGWHQHYNLRYKLSKKLPTYFLESIKY